ncbi:MAG TPA: spermidine synthase, partial [Azospira sp.]|nr:spermidine synthase [Azospira sp.]
MAEGGEQYDLILADAWAGGWDTLPFYHHCREQLTAEELLSINPLFATSAERLSPAFDGHSQVFPSCDSTN